MLENISGSDLKSQFQSNKKLQMITYIVGGLAVVVLGYFVYKQFIWNPENEKSKEVYFSALNLADQDSTDAAIDALRPLVKKYDGKIGGEIAQFTYARQLMAKGKYKEALDELKGVQVKDMYVSVMAVGLQGDCKSEMKNYEEAAELYIKAADMQDNDYTTPTFLFKAALCAEEVSDFDAALNLYNKIEHDYPDFASQKTIKKYIAKATKSKK